MKQSDKIRTSIEIIKMEVIERIKNIVETNVENSDNCLSFDELGMEIQFGEDDSINESEILSLINVDGGVMTSFDNEFKLHEFSLDFLLDILSKFEDHFEVGKIIYPDLEPSSDLVEKFAEICSLRFDSYEDHKEVYHILKEKMQTGEVTEQSILDEYEEINK
jgi:hypothetical protein